MQRRKSQIKGLELELTFEKSIKNQLEQGLKIHFVSMFQLWCPPFSFLTLVVIQGLNMLNRFQHYHTNEINKAGFIVLKQLHELPAVLEPEYSALNMHFPFIYLLGFLQREITWWLFWGSAAAPFDSCCTSFWTSANALFIVLTFSAFLMFIWEGKKYTHWYF